MESLMRPKIQKYKHKAYGRSKANAPCRKHPKHTQSPGVCSLCLNERLFRLTRAKRTPKSPPPSSSSSSSSSSYISSLSSSDCSSPVLSYAPSRARRSTKPLEDFAGETLNKSRSMAFFSLRRKQEDRSVEMKRGFWSKLLSGKNKALMHSRTTRERVQ